MLTLLSPGGNFAVRTALSDELLGISLADHIADLDHLRRNFPAAHRCVILGHFVEAFELLVLPMDHCWFATLVATHMKCFAIRTAHERVRDVGDVCAERYGNRFDDNERQFQTAGQVILRTVAAPATIVQRLVADQAAGRFKNLSDERVLPRAIERKLLPDGDGKSVIDVAMDVRCRLTAKAGAPIDIKIYNALRDAGRLCRPAAALTRGTMKAKKLDNMEFIEHLTGLTAAEAASYVAEQLVRACADIEAFVLHRLPNWTPPPKPRSQPWLKSYGFVANVLRSEAQCDRHAPKPQPGKEFDFESGAGRKQVRSMREKIKLDPKIEAAAAERFGIDPSPWFTCRASLA